MLFWVINLLVYQNIKKYRCTKKNDNNGEKGGGKGKEEKV